jgi:hypothetical protein
MACLGYSGTSILCPLRPDRRPDPCVATAIQHLDCGHEMSISLAELLARHFHLAKPERASLDSSTPKGSSPLTEIYNGRSLDDIAGRLISQARRRQAPLTFLMEINTLSGHLTGADITRLELELQVQLGTAGRLGCNGTAEKWRGDYSDIGDIVRMIQEIERIKGDTKYLGFLLGLAQGKVVGEIEIEIDEPGAMHGVAREPRGAIVDDAVIIVVSSGGHVHGFVGI